MMPRLRSSPVVSGSQASVAGVASPTSHVRSTWSPQSCECTTVSSNCEPSMRERLRRGSARWQNCTGTKTSRNAPRLHSLPASYSRSAPAAACRARTAAREAAERSGSAVVSKHVASWALHRQKAHLVDVLAARLAEQRHEVSVLHAQDLHDAAARRLHVEQRLRAVVERDAVPALAAHTLVSTLAGVSAAAPHLGLYRHRRRVGHHVHRSAAARTLR